MIWIHFKLGFYRIKLEQVFTPHSEISHCNKSSILKCNSVVLWSPRKKNRGSSVTVVGAMGHHLTERLEKKRDFLC